MRTLLWHFEDLRLKGNLALQEALKSSTYFIPLFIHTEENKGIGSASKWWLQESLHALSVLYKERGSSLFFLKGNPLKIIPSLVKDFDIDKVCWNQSFVPHYFQMQQELLAVLRKLEITTEIFNSNHLLDPRQILTKQETPYTVFTPFYKTALKILADSEDPSFSLKKSFPPPPPTMKGLSLEKAGSFPSCSWHYKLKSHWNPGSFQAELLAKDFLKKRADAYPEMRDVPSVCGTSKLSPYLHFGEISPRSLWHLSEKAHPAFARQLLWREFATYLLFHNPHITTENWDPHFDHFAWDRSSSLLKKWEQGKTGYPLIDAGMRQLWETGWMHNRVRMVVASFLTKDLLLHWKNGERWFWDTLVDADIGNNVFGWQWAAGTGPDAAPYFRIFNPVLQSKKFDPEGRYIKTYLPELSRLDPQWIHTPWLAPKNILAEADIFLGKTYPYPIVDHDQVKQMALTRYKACRRSSS